MYSMKTFFYIVSGCILDTFYWAARSSDSNSFTILMQGIVLHIINVGMYFNLRKLEVYSHLKNLIESKVHPTPTAKRITTDAIVFSKGNPNAVAFNNLIPCVNGNKSITA